MKKAILTALIILVFTVAKSQLTKNTWLVGGTGKMYAYNGEYTNTNSAFNTTSKYTDISLSANVGYFLIDKLVAGLKPSFSSFKGKVTSNGGLETNTNKFYVGPFARYYFLNSDKPFNILIDASCQLGINNWITRKGKIINYAVMGGPEIFFNNSIGLEFLMGYLYQKESIEDTQSGFTDIKHGLQISIGLQIHLEKN